MESLEKSHEHSPNAASDAAPDALSASGEWHLLECTHQIHAQKHERVRWCVSGGSLQKRSRHRTQESVRWYASGDSARKHPLCVRVRCVSDASGGYLTASGSLEVTVRNQHTWFKQWTRDCVLSTRHRGWAPGGSPAACPVAPCFVQWKSQRLYLFEGLINSCWPALGACSCTLEHLRYTLS